MTAIFSSNDLGAIELLDVADRLGVNVPDDLSVVGFDDVLMAGLSRINLTTVAQPQEELARQSLATLAARMQGELTGDPVRRTVELKLVVRGSTAVPRVVQSESRISMTKRLKVGVIGCGLIAQVMHLHYLRELSELMRNRSIVRCL